MDRRIGEKNRDMTAEDRTIARFTAERVKLHKKKSIFNLGDDEILTHRGQTLNEIEKFDDPRSEDEFDDEDDDKQGGRLTSKSSKNSITRPTLTIYLIFRKICCGSSFWWRIT